MAFQSIQRVEYRLQPHAGIELFPSALFGPDEGGVRRL